MFIDAFYCETISTQRSVLGCNLSLWFSFLYKSERTCFKMSNKKKEQDFMIVHNTFQTFSNIAMAILRSSEDRIYCLLQTV